MDQSSGNKLIRDRYEAIDLLGRGGQGEVWKALDRQHGRAVALKMRPVAEGEHRERILSEARILLTLRPHPNLPLVREDFFWDDGYVLVMDWVEGTDLGALLLETGDPGLPVSSVLAWLSQAAAGIDHLHSHGVVHGDVKPANLVLTPEGRVVLVDFGISRLDDDDGPLLTGSPGYAAPESSDGVLSSAADVFGLAATAVALLTGALPAGGPPEWDAVPNAAAIERALRRGLASDPVRRPRSASQLIERLQAHLFLDLPTGVVTFLLTDIEGSTARWENDPDAMADLLALHDELVAESIESGGGRLLKTRGEGDSTFSVFTRASDAIAAALAAQRSLREETGLSVRMAIHTGEAETRGGDYFGRTVNRAARLRSIAQGGQILLSSAAADLVVDGLPDGADLIDLGFHELRDLARGEQVFALSHPALEPVESIPGQVPAPVPARADSPVTEPAVVDGAQSVPLVPSRPSFPQGLDRVRSASFVGRRTELNSLRDAWRAASGGERRLVFIAGDSGAGKTQLAAEIANEAYDDGAFVLHGGCDDGSQAPFQPFATALRQHVVDADAAGVTPVLGRLAGELVRLVPDVASLPPGLTPPIHADPETEQYRLFDAVSQWLQALADESPVVLVIDDLQWAGRPTLQLLRHVFRSTESVPLLLVGTYRDTDVGRDHPLTRLLEVAALRVAAVSEATTATLEVAALIGEEFDLEVLVRAGRLDDDAVLTALDEAVAARLVLEFAPLRYRFTDDTVRETILDGLTEPRRSRAHHRVTEAIELLGTSIPSLGKSRRRRP